MSGRNSGIAARAVVMALLVASCTTTPPANPSASSVPTERTRPAPASDQVEPPSPAAASPAAPSMPVEPSPPPSPSAPAPSPLSPDPTPVLPLTTSLMFGPLRIDGLARVVVDRLRVRSAPGTGADSTIQAEPLMTGDEVFVIAGPVPADGYQWWEVQVVRPAVYGRFGWVAAASRDGEIWASPASVDCPAAPSIADLDWLGGAGALVCYGRREIQLRAFRRQFCGDGIATVARSPDWIAGVFGGDSLFDRKAYQVDETALEIYGRAHPSLLEAGTPYFNCGEEGTGWFDITGHFDDPVSSGCRATEYDTEFSGEGQHEEPALSITRCRQTFVYTELRPATGP